jgi:hypothetical protein
MLLLLVITRTASVMMFVVRGLLGVLHVVGGRCRFFAVRGRHLVVIIISTPSLGNCCGE